MRKKRREQRIRHILLTVFLCFWITQNIASARVGFSPAIQEIKVRRNVEEKFFITLTNSGDQIVKGKIYFADLDIDQYGCPFEPNDNYKRGCASWITASPSELRLEPKKPLKVECIVKVPKESVGGYYAFIKGEFFEGLPGESEFRIPFSENKKGAESLIRFRSELAAVVILTVEDRNNKAVLRPDTLIIKPGSHDQYKALISNSKKGWITELAVTNIGNVHAKAEGEVSIWTESGRLVERKELVAGQGYIFPDRQRIFSASGEIPLSDGTYIIRIILTTREGKSIKKVLPFYVLRNEAFAGGATEKTKNLIKALSPGFKLKKPFKSINVRGGGIHLAVLPIENMTKDTLQLVPGFIYWGIQDDGAYVLNFENKTDSLDIKSWFNWEQDTLILFPLKAVNFKARVKIPKNLPGGEYFAGIIFERIGTQFDLPAIVQMKKMNIICLVNNRDLIKDIEIDSLKVQRGKDEDLITCLVRNVGNSHCVINAVLYLSKEIAFERFDLMGQGINFPMRDTWILPGGIRNLLFTVPSLEKGRYEGQIIVNFAYGEKTRSRIQRFSIN